MKTTLPPCKLTFHFFCAIGLLLNIFILAAIPARLSAGGFAYAIRPRTFRFPFDHGSHPDFKTEWWYVTGNLRSVGGRRWGFQITIFRNAILPPGHKGKNRWKVRNLYLLNTAISDIKRDRFLYFRDFARAGPGICGAKTGSMDVWMKTARMTMNKNKLYLSFKGETFSLQLICLPLLPPVLNGKNGLSQKGPRPGQATYYYSLPSLKTCGTIKTQEGSFQVTGISWFDHEFGTSQLAPDQAGWDWVSLHLSDGSHLMVYRIRKTNGNIEPTSSATYIGPNGKPTCLYANQFRFIPLPGGESLVHGILYPLKWKLEIFHLNLKLILSPWMKSQAWPGKKEGEIPYWEGAIQAYGRRGKIPVSGEGYLELTGYGKRLRWKK